MIFKSGVKLWGQIVCFCDGVKAQTLTGVWLNFDTNKSITEPATVH